MKKNSIYAAVVTLLVVAFTLIWFYLLPGFVEREILSAIHDAGIRDVSIQFEKLTFSKLTLEEVVVGEEPQLRIDRVEVSYDFESLKNGQVKTITMNGATLKLQMNDGTVDLPLLEELESDKAESDGASRLPFDNLEIDTSTLSVNWEGEGYTLPIELAIRNMEGDRTLFELQSSLESAPISLNATIDMDTYGGACSLKVDGLSAELVRKLSSHYLPEQGVKAEGSLDIDGSVELHRDQWVGKFTVSGDSLSIHSRIPSSELELNLTALEADLTYTSQGAATIDLKSTLNRSLVSLRGTVDINSYDGEVEVDMQGIDSEFLENLVAVSLPEEYFGANGNLSARVNLLSRDGSAVAKMKLNGEHLSVQTEKGGHDAQLSRSMMEGEISFAHDSSAVSEIRGSLKITDLDIANESMGLSARNFACTLPFSWDKKEIEPSSFSFGKLQYEDYELPALSGSFKMRDNRFAIEAIGNVPHEENLEISGWLDLGREELFGEFNALISRFELEDGSSLAEHFPVLSAYEFGGTVSGHAHIQVDGDQLTPNLGIEIVEGFWKDSSSEADVNGIEGSLQINGLEPLTTDGDQTFTVKTVTFGSLEAADAVAVFQLHDDESIFLKSIECSWAGGKLSSNDVIIQPAGSSVSFDLHAERVELQEILNFLDYEGVTGSGWIYGHLPLKLDLGERKRVHFGDGVLETRPKNGRLQLSRETAMVILGMTEELDPETASNEEMVTLLVLDALQDMEYSELKTTFDTEPGEGLVTHIQIQGYGPVGEEENKIPIEGLIINISNLDDLLNSMIFPDVGIDQVNGM